MSVPEHKLRGLDARIAPPAAGQTYASRTDFTRHLEVYTLHRGVHFYRVMPSNSVNDTYRCGVCQHGEVKIKIIRKSAKMGTNPEKRVLLYLGARVVHSLPCLSNCLNTDKLSHPIITQLVNTVFPTRHQFTRMANNYFAGQVVKRGYCDTGSHIVFFCKEPHCMTGRIEGKLQPSKTVHGKKTWAPPIVITKVCLCSVQCLSRFPTSAPGDSLVLGEESELPINHLAQKLLGKSKKGAGRNADVVSSIVDKTNPNQPTRIVTCELHSLRRLRPAKWVKDEAINFFITLLRLRDHQLFVSGKIGIRSHFFSTFFYTRLTQFGPTGTSSKQGPVPVSTAAGTSNEDAIDLINDEEDENQCPLLWVVGCEGNSYTGHLPSHPNYHYKFVAKWGGVAPTGAWSVH